MTSDPKPDDNQIKLYALLIDQMQKYSSIIWQVPTAILVANFFAIDKFITEPTILLALFGFNIALIYAFYRMVTQQRAIIDAVRRSETELKNTYNTFIPSFSETKIRAPMLFVIVLAVLNGGLFVYAIYLFVTP